MFDNLVAQQVLRARYRSRSPATNVPIFGRLDSRGGYALVAMHFQLHVPQIRPCSGINGEA